VREERRHLKIFVAEVFLYTDFPGVTCLRCHAGGMVMSTDLIECTQCGASYPVLERVPVIFERVILPSKQDYGAMQTARDLLAAFDLPTDAMHILKMRRLIARRPVFGETMVQTEAAQFLARVQASGWSVAETKEERPASVHLGNVHLGTEDVQLRVRWLRDYIPRIIPVGKQFTANVRFRNNGAVELKHLPPENVTISARWYRTDGRPVEDALDVRTPLPLTIRPGQELTLPLRIAAPLQTGRYCLRLLLVQEGVRWWEDDAMEIPVVLRQGSWMDTPPGWRFNPDMQLDYDADHVRGLEIMREWMAGLNVRYTRVLEIGGNVYPVIAEIEGELHNVDVDLLGLQIGCLVQDRMELERNGRRVHQLCASGDELPYADSYFDAIVIFAALHHFPDPARTLAHIATKLRPGGFIGLFCEPVGHIDADNVEIEYLRELQRGVNEQSFVMREWADIFRAAQLRATDAIVEGGSLKVRLVHALTRLEAVPL
jgi:SAM-dependent methyltransferase